jgi:hypothetical protein
MNRVFSTSGSYNEHRAGSMPEGPDAVVLVSALTLVSCNTKTASPPSSDRFLPEVETQMAQIVKDQRT